MEILFPSHLTYFWQNKWKTFFLIICCNGKHDFLCGCSSVGSSLDKCRCLYLESFYKTPICKQKCNQDNPSLQSLSFSPSSQCFPQVTFKCFKFCIQVGMELRCLKTSIQLQQEMFSFFFLWSSFIAHWPFYAVWDMAV